MYKIIFIDIDGTLRNDKKEITNRTKIEIQKIVEKGIPIVICSGRYRQYTEEVSKEALASDYVIACNGGEIYNYKDKEIIYENNLKKQTIIDLYQLAKKYDVEFDINSRDKKIVFNKSDSILEESVEEFVETHTSTQCVFADGDATKIKAIKAEIDKLEDIEIINLSKSLLYENVPVEPLVFLDVVCKGTSKGNAIKKLCEYLKINLKDCVAIGDSYNDLPMFGVVGHRVVMGNALEDIKKVADEVTDSNNEDGVAKFLEKLNKEVF